MTDDAQKPTRALEHELRGAFTGPNAGLLGQIAKTAIQRIDAHGELDTPYANALVTATRRALSKNASRRAFKLVTRVLVAINDTGLARCGMPRQRHQTMRPQTLAPSILRFEQQSTASAMDQHLEQWLKKRDGTDPMDRVLALALRLVVRTGMGEGLVSGSLARLTPARIRDKAGLLLPIDVADFSPAVYRWPLPSACRSLLPSLTERAAAPTSLLFAEALGEPIDETLSEDERIEAALAKQKAVGEQLKQAFKGFAADFERDGISAHGARLRSWSSFCSVARFIPQGRGVLPALITMGERFPLPACADLFTLDERASHPHRRRDDSKKPALPVNAPRPPESLNRLTAPAGGAIFETHRLPEDWAGTARRLLNRFRRDAEALSGKHGYVTTRNHAQLKARCKQYMDEADALWDEPSLLHVGLGWLRELALHGARVSTLETYISRLFAVETFQLEPAINLNLWDDDTVEEMTAAIVTSRAWQRSTVGHFLQAWGDCLRYAQRINVLSDVEKIPGPQTGVHTAKRIEILSPYAAGVMWRRCREHGGEWGEQAAAAVMLGFYAGLRANEVLSLTLADVVIDPGELGLVINYGKTDAAKRQIPLEVLAPRELVAWFTEWVARRWAQFTDPALRNRPENQIAVFGPAGNPAGYARKALIDPLIRWMRTSLGDDVDFHLLRHSFASWLVLRFYAMRHPGFAERLPQRAATMFQPHALEQLRVCHDGDVYRRDGIDDAAHIRKLTGHESLHTTLLYYVHTLDWVHADVMRRAFNEGPRRKLA